MTVRRSALLVAGLVGATILAASAAIPPSAPVASAADRDCSDFRSQAQAQAFFDRHGRGDPHRLDSDGDGKACEDLPCPCGRGGGGRGDQGGGGGRGGGGGDDRDRTSRRERAAVVKVTDGDTIKVRRQGRTVDVRLLGIDTPEVFFGEECGGSAASRSLKRMLHRGDRVQLVRDPSQDNRDGFGRLLRYVIKGGRDVGCRQISRGWAKAFVFERPFRRVRRYRLAQRRARVRDLGVWSLCGGRFHAPF